MASLSRRHFLKASSVGLAAIGISGAPACVRTSVKDDLRVAVIGIRSRGQQHISGLAKHVVAICDCDEAFLEERGTELGPQVAKYQDYRKLLERSDIDAVSIATPNHTHSSIAIEALQAGKHVYVEKPVSHNVWEGRQLVNAARKYDRLVQCGTQSRSSKALQAAVKFVHDGNLGKIQYIVGTCFKPRKSIGKLDKALKIPSTVDYNLWCGPAEKKPLFRPQFHYDWHWDFNTGNGDMGNQGIHQMDIARWFLGADGVSPRVWSIGQRLGYQDAGDTPNTQTVLHDYPQAPIIFETRGLPKSKQAQKNWGRSMDNFRGSQIGVIVQCEQGSVLSTSNYGGALALDNDGNKIKQWSGGGDHFQNFIQAVQSGRREDLNADILEGHVSSALCHTGNISHQMGQQRSRSQIEEALKDSELFTQSFERMAKHLAANEIDIDSPALSLGPVLQMDPETEQFTNNEQANQLLTREYRKPFVVPAVAAS